MHSDLLKGIQTFQGRWQYGEKVGSCYPSGLEKTLLKWNIYVPMVTKGLLLSTSLVSHHMTGCHDINALLHSLLRLSFLYS